MSELHIAITNNQSEAVRSILAQSLCNIHEQDEKGDQPAHIAARLNHIDCIKVLVEYDAQMGWKNFSGLTPLGEAKLNCNTEIITLIKENYTTNIPEESWHSDIDRATDGWQEKYDDINQRMQWVRLSSSGDLLEVSDTPPPLDIQRVIHAREALGERRVRRIHPKSLVSMKQLGYEKERQLQNEKLALMLKKRHEIVEIRCATKLQAHWRKVKARLEAVQRKREEVAANRIQRRFKYFLAQKKEHCAIRIQSVIRMSLTLTYYKAYNRERLWWYRASRNLAVTAQSLWRGFKDRSLYRQLLEMKRLPDPTDTRHFDFWEACQYEAHPPKRELGIYAEYTLSGTPTSWQERNGVKRDGIYYRDVVFYANTITKRATWDKPKGWLFKDHREYYVLRLQTFWRARIAKRKIRLYTKAKLLLENAHSQDLESTKQDIASLCNYTLYVHCVLHDYDTSRGLYLKMMDFMNHRGVDNAFVLYSYAIFQAVTNEEDWTEIKEYARRAKLADDRMQLRRKKNKDPNDKREESPENRSSYHIATAAFYLQPICNEHELAESWHNYALCQMLVLHDMEGARESFTRAMINSPRDKCIISNFNTLLQDEDYMNNPTSNAYEEYLKATKKY